MQDHPQEHTRTMIAKGTSPAFYTCGQLAKKHDVCRQRIRNYCAEGIIPFVRKVGQEWIIDERGAKFLEHWLNKQAALGAFWKTEMATRAAALDQECAERQQASGMADAMETRLRPDDVQYIRRQRARGVSLLDIADSPRIKPHGLTASGISRICSGNRRAYIRRRSDSKAVRS